MDISSEQFDKAVRDLAHEDGVLNILAIPGVWELVSEHYNDAIDRINKENEED